MNSDFTAAFNDHKPLLFSIAYRMLGSVMDAEDMVQETFIRWQKGEHAKVESPKAWLSTVITRLSINHLKSARVQRETYVGPWLPEPLIAGLSVDPAENAKLSDSLSLAFLVLLESLSPTERAVFVLREVFNYEFSEIAPIVAKTEENCRQILARARKPQPPFVRVMSRMFLGPPMLILTLISFRFISDPAHAAATRGVSLTQPEAVTDTRVVGAISLTLAILILSAILSKNRLRLGHLVVILVMGLALTVPTRRIPR
jgi:RNA polymerase sigma factor (sigma-70 family)